MKAKKILGGLMALVMSASTMVPCMGMNSVIANAEHVQDQSLVDSLKDEK